MLLRRVTEHVRSQNWFAVLLDFLIVVIGIYLGLQASAWQESRQDKHREGEILERLRSDFAIIGEDIDNALKYHRGIIDGMNAVLAASETGYVSDQDHDRFIYGLDSALKYSAGAGSSSTYVDILSSGQTFLINDPGLRSALSEYDNLHRDSAMMFLQFWQAQRNHEIAFSRHFEMSDTREWIDEADVFAPGSVTGFDVESMAEDAEFRLAAQRLADYQTYFQIRHLQMRAAAQEVCDLLDGLYEEEADTTESPDPNDEDRATCARPSKTEAD